jgi:RNA polymerase sigma-70 factor (ECF subfamily)
MDNGDDQRVIAAVLAGETDAYAVLVERYQKPIFNLMVRMTGSTWDALDLAQETFIKAFEQLHRFRLEKKFFPWLYTIGLNHSKNFIRQRKLVQTYSLDGCEAGCDPGNPRLEEEKLCARLDAVRITRALEELPFDYREAVILRYHEELTMDEIASALCISVSGAKMRVHRGLKKLREILEGESDGVEEAKASG